MHGICKNCTKWLVPRMFANSGSNRTYHILSRQSCSHWKEVTIQVYEIIGILFGINAYVWAKIAATCACGHDFTTTYECSTFGWGLIGSPRLIRLECKYCTNKMMFKASLYHRETYITSYELCTTLGKPYPKSNCIDCNSEGFIDDNLSSAKIDCTKCTGNGTVKCPICKASGIYKSVICTRCHGKQCLDCDKCSTTGKIPKQKPCSSCID